MFIDSKTTNKSKISLGDWFSFNAIFDEKAKIYRILSVIKLVHHHKYLFKQIDGEEDAFMVFFKFFFNFKLLRTFANKNFYEKFFFILRTKNLSKTFFVQFVLDFISELNKFFKYL